MMMTMMTTTMIMTTMIQNKPALAEQVLRGPPPVTGGKEEWMSDYRVDEDNVEWGEDQDGNWWYRDPGASDWSEWSD